MTDRKIKKKKLSIGAIIRRVIQLAAFILFPGLFISVFSGIKAIYTSAISGSFHFSVLLPQIIIVAAVLLVTILMGRFFCGYLCAFGSMQDLFGWLSKKLFKKKPVIGEKADFALKAVKYVFLLFIVVFVWTLGAVSFDNSLNPWNIFGMYSSVAGWADLSGFLTAGFVFLALIIVGSFFIDRFFCRYLCPLGAIFAVLSKLRLVRIKKESTACGACRVCTKSCPMGIPLYRSEQINSMECIDCFQCVGACPKGNLKTSIAGEEIAPAAAGLIAAASMAGLYYVGSIVPSQTAGSSTDAAATQVDYTNRLDQGPYTDGENTGSATGYRGTTSVQVTVENGYISDIEVTSTGDDAQFFNMCKDQVITEILENQSTDVSAVTGATYSSNAIMNAVADALELPFSVSQDEDIDEPAESVNTAPVESGNTVTVSPSAAAGYTDGVYTGSGQGYRGETTVSVTVSGGKISAIEILSYEDDRQFFEQASDAVIEEIISSQSVEVSAVSGATFSSNGIMEAVADALGIDYQSDIPQNGQHGHGNHAGLIS